jgi:hypothetical protein
MGQIAIMGSYDAEKIKNIAKRLAGIAVEGNYSFDKLEVTPEGIE